MKAQPVTDRPLFSVFVGDGKPLLLISSFSLLLSGVAILFLGVCGYFLPHDLAFLGISSDELNSVADGRVAGFMIHNRISFGGALMSVGLFYAWLCLGPLQAGKRWAWWVLAISGGQGFVNFLSFLGYGYLDSWHALATLCLLVTFLVGLALSYPSLEPSNKLPHWELHWWSPTWDRLSISQVVLLLTALGLIGGGLTINWIAMNQVFVPQDLTYMDMCPNRLADFNPKLIPLIAHDRAGFGGAVCCNGLILLGIVRHGKPSVSMWQVIYLGGLLGFGTAIWVHPAVGYNSLCHLVPPLVGLSSLLLGLFLLLPYTHRR